MLYWHVCHPRFVPPLPVTFTIYQPRVCQHILRCQFPRGREQFPFPNPDINRDDTAWRTCPVQNHCYPCKYIKSANGRQSDISAAARDKNERNPQTQYAFLFSFPFHPFTSLPFSKLPRSTVGIVKASITITFSKQEPTRTP